MKKIFLLIFIIFISCKKKSTHDLIIWHWMTDREEVFEQLSNKYFQQTGVKVRFELFAPSDAYSHKIRAAAQTNTLPDIFGVLVSPKEFASFIKAGHIANLTETIMNDKDWYQSFFESALKTCRFVENNNLNVPPGIYAVPIDVTNIQMLYNKKLFKKAGLNPEHPPETFTEFLEYCEKLKKNGIPCFVSGWGELWLINCFANNYAFNILGEQKILDTFYGKVKYTDSDWLTVFKIFQTLAKKNIVLKDSITMINKIAEQNFSLERVAFTFNGSWCVNVYKQMNPQLEYAVMLPPRFTNFPMKIWGGAGSPFVINAKSKNKDNAIKFLKWLTQKEQQIFLTQKTSNIPSNKYASYEINPILKQFADDMDKITHPLFWPVEEEAEVNEVFAKGIQSILSGEKTPEEVAKQVQITKEKYLK